MLECGQREYGLSHFDSEYLQLRGQPPQPYMTTPILEYPQPPYETKPKSDPALEELVAIARTYKMTPEEAYEQRRSFVKGLCPSHRDYATWCQQVDEIMPPLSKARQCS